MAGRYYIRNRGKRTGPLTAEKLQAMARRGRFGRHFEVSTDGKRWSRADDFPELFPGGGAVDDEMDGNPFDEEGSPDEDLADDPYAPIVDDKPKRRARPSAGGKTARGRRGRQGGGAAEPKPKPKPEEIPPAELGEPARKKKKKKKKKNIFQEASGKPREKKKRGGIMGFLFGNSEPEYDDQPHLRKLTHIHGTLRDIGFTLSDVQLVGSGGEKISVGDHEGSGDGPHLLGLLMVIGFQSRTTDMHFEPSAEGVDVRMRIDGNLVPLVHIETEHCRRFYGIIKVLCETKMGASQEVLEGNYSVVAPGRRSDYRVSFTPAVHGQKLAIRVLDADNAPMTLRQLGAPGSYVSTVGSVMKQNAGMVLMCGPTGSGKTTSLYAMLRSVDFKSRNVMTLEDPVEYQIDGITQINIDSEHGKGFGDMLPALLRQDPDVLLIGEIRDAISAKIAMQATMTGHLVLSTVHAPDTLATVHRLLDLNADPNMVGSALDLVMSQRLLRVLCEDCKARRRTNDDDRRRLGNNARDAIYEPKGCKKCLGTGYSGRRAIFELLDVKKQLGDAIYQNPTVVDLRKAVKGTRFSSLRNNGYALVGQGVTTCQEVDRVIGIE